MGKFIEVGKAFETALFSGDTAGLQKVLHKNVFYEMSGFPPIGGRFDGRDNVIQSFEDRAVGLGPGFEYEQLARDWFEDSANGKVFVEIHEKSWLAAHPDDVLIVRTCSVLTVVGDQITSIIDYTDSQAYSEFKDRHAADIPKFARG